MSSSDWPAVILWAFLIGGAIFTSCDKIDSRTREMEEENISLSEQVDQLQYELEEAEVYIENLEEEYNIPDELSYFSDR